MYGKVSTSGVLSYPWRSWLRKLFAAYYNIQDICIHCISWLFLNSFSSIHHLPLTFIYTDFYICICIDLHFPFLNLDWLSLPLVRFTSHK